LKKTGIYFEKRAYPSRKRAYILKFYSYTHLHGHKRSPVCIYFSEKGPSSKKGGSFSIKALQL
jgi:hypothetical protein